MSGIDSELDLAKREAKMWQDQCMQAREERDSYKQMWLEVCKCRMRSIAERVHECAVEHGWWPEGVRQIPELLMLQVSELAEALEEYRLAGSETNAVYVGSATERTPITNPVSFFNENPICKPEGFGIEIADCIIRIFDMCCGLGIDIESLVLLKHKYNMTRPFRHGNKKA